MSLPPVYRRILVFSLYAAAVAATCALYYYLFRPFYRPQQSAAAFWDNILTLCPAAALSATLAGAMAHYQERREDGFYAAFLTWLVLCAIVPLWHITKGILLAIVLLQDPFVPALPDFLKAAFEAIFYFAMFLIMSAPTIAVAAVIFWLLVYVVRRWKPDY